MGSPTYRAPAFSYSEEFTPSDDTSTYEKAHNAFTGMWVDGDASDGTITIVLAAEAGDTSPTGMLLTWIVGPALVEGFAIIGVKSTGTATTNTINLLR